MIVSLEAGALGHTRFSLSPLLETTLSLRLLTQQRPWRVHAPWLERVRTRIRGLDLELLLSLLPPGSSPPSFLVPPGRVPAPSVREQLSELEDVAAEDLARDLRRAWAGRPLPGRALALLESGPDAGPTLAGASASTGQRRSGPSGPGCRVCTRTT